MEYLEIAPPPALRHHIRTFWFLSGRPRAARIEPVVPDARVEIVLHLAEPFSLVEDGRPARQHQAVISGQLTRAIHVAPADAADVMGIRFRTAAAGAALRLPMDSLRDCVVPLREVRRDLEEELLIAASGVRAQLARADRVARVLMARLAPALDPIARRAAHLLGTAGSPAPIATLAAQTGLTVRTLERRVQSRIGYAPKTLQQILRFRRAYQRLEAGQPAARVAAESGYYDQAHLIRAFRRLTGSPPATFFRAAPDLASALMSHPSNTPAP